MAITRCPYCRAIVDEKDQYCTNCGTQILYAEDAEVEEEIPGEKILASDAEDKDYSIPAPGESARDSAEKDDEAEDEEPDRKDAEEADEVENEDVIVLEESEAPDKPATEELASVLKAGEREPEAKPQPEAPRPPARRGRRRGPDVIQPAFNFGAAPEPKQDPKTGPVEPGELVEKAPATPEPEAAEEAPAAPAAEGGTEAPAGAEGPAGDDAGPERSPMAVTFDTRELEAIGPTVDLGRHQIEQFLEVLREKEEAVAAARAPGLPPWADGLKETPAPESVPESEPEVEPDVEAEPGFEGEAGEEEDAERTPDTAAETPLFRTDSGVGLPERISQAKLPFAREETADEEAGLGDREPGEEEEEEREPRPPFRLSVFLKAKTFDILFIVAVWLVTLWLAARALERTIFELFASASTPLLLFGAALFVLYVFLFRFFLGETLGDRLFRDSDEDAEA
jgi:hypothetical protein